MQAHPLPVHQHIISDVLDEDFDSYDVSRPFKRKPVRKESTMLFDEQSWDDFSADDMLYELQE